MAGVRLSDLLPDNLEEAGKRAVGSLRQRDDVGCEKLAWDIVSNELEGALGRALDCDLVGLVAECWAQSRILADFADPQKHPRGERSVVELGAHEFSRDVHPVLGRDRRRLLLRRVALHLCTYRTFRRCEAHRRGRPHSRRIARRSVGRRATQLRKCAAAQRIRVEEDAPFRRVQPARRGREDPAPRFVGPIGLAIG